jgi:hypothetical protein
MARAAVSRSTTDRPVARVSGRLVGWMLFVVAPSIAAAGRYDDDVDWRKPGRKQRRATDATIRRRPVNGQAGMARRRTSFNP